MARILAVADEIVEALWTEQVHRLCAAGPDGRDHGSRPGRPGRIDLVLAAGDLPFDYLEYLADALDRPCVFVPGNHDADLGGYVRARGMWLRGGFPARWPGPGGAVNADGTVVDVAGLRIAGLGGSIRYNDGPNQWTERQQTRRARRLTRTAARRRLRDGRGVDVLVTHAPPKGLGDGDDPPHRGFACLHDTVRRLRPGLLVHGHIHPHGQPVPDRTLGGTRVVNTVGYRILELPPPRAARRSGHYEGQPS